MYKKGLFLSILFVSCAYGQHDIALPILSRDPFQVTNKQDCQKLKNRYLSEIKQWYWSGFIYAQVDLPRPNTNFEFQLWLSAEAKWVTITPENRQLFNSVWSLSEIHNNTLIWQHSLPDYCYSSMIYTMHFAEKP